MLTAFSRIACEVDLADRVTGEGWLTSATKLLDTALIGFCVLGWDGAAEVSPVRASEMGAMNAIAGDGQSSHAFLSFEVRGYPSAKNEALSMLGASHSHAPAYGCCWKRPGKRWNSRPDFVPLDSGDPVLHVVLERDEQHGPWDATNYLGGIADVLKNKSHRVAAVDLGDLAPVHLYRNDRQIREISYREVPEAAGQAGYRVSIRRR